MGRSAIAADMACPALASPPLLLLLGGWEAHTPHFLHLLLQLQPRLVCKRGQVSRQVGTCKRGRVGEGVRVKVTRPQESAGEPSPSFDTDNLLGPLLPALTLTDFWHWPSSLRSRPVPPCLAQKRLLHWRPLALLSLEFFPFRLALLTCHGRSRCLCPGPGPAARSADARCLLTQQR